MYETVGSSADEEKAEKHFIRRVVSIAMNKRMGVRPGCIQKGNSLDLYRRELPRKLSGACLPSKNPSID